MLISNIGCKETACTLHIHRTDKHSVKFQTFQINIKPNNKHSAKFWTFQINTITKPNNKHSVKFWTFQINVQTKQLGWVEAGNGFPVLHSPFSEHQSPCHLNTILSMLSRISHKTKVSRNVQQEHCIHWYSGWVTALPELAGIWEGPAASHSAWTWCGTVPPPPLPYLVFLLCFYLQTVLSRCGSCHMLRVLVPATFPARFLWSPTLMLHNPVSTDLPTPLFFCYVFIYRLFSHVVGCAICCAFWFLPLSLRASSGPPLWRYIIQ